jgi:excisionase family DNA binding protein
MESEFLIGYAARPLVVDAKEAARLLGVSHGTIINMYKSGELPSVQIRRRVLIRVSDLEAYLDRNIRNRAKRTA